MSVIGTMKGPADAAAIGGIATALSSFWDALPTVLGIIGGTLAIIWYGVLFYDRFVAKGPAADNEEGS